MDRGRRHVQLAGDGPEAKPSCRELLHVNGASVDGCCRGCPPALGQPRRSAQPDAALAAAPGPAAEPSTEHRYQLKVMLSGRTRLVLLFAQKGGGWGQRRRPGVRDAPPGIGSGEFAR